MSRRSTEELVADYLRAGGKITKCPPGPGLIDYRKHRREWQKGLFEPPHLNHPEIEDEAFDWPYNLTMEGGIGPDELEPEVREPLRYRDARSGVKVVEYFDD